MMRLTFTRLLMFGFATLLWITGAFGQITVTPSSPYLETFDSFTTGSGGYTTSFTLSPTSAGWSNVSGDGGDFQAFGNAPTSANSGPNRDFTTCGTGSCANSGTAQGNFLYNECSGAANGATFILQGPTFNIAALNDPTLSFYYHMVFNGAPDGSLQVILDNGSTTTTALTLTGSQQASESSPWEEAVVKLCGLGNTVSVRFVVTVGTSTSSFYYDCGLDQVSVSNGGGGTDIELSSLVAPVPGGLCASFGTNEQITVSIKNTTCNQLNFATNPVTITYSGTGPTNPSGSFVLNTGTLAGNTSQNVNIGNANLSAAGVYTLDVSVAMPGDGDATNNSITGATFKSGTISTFPYAENFENGDGGWEVTGSNTSFALGAANGSVINTNAPGGGSNSWITNPTGNYNNGENGAVVSPCFDMTSLNNPVIQFDAWWDCEFSWDGAVLQYSTNGGQGWSNVGVLNDPNAENWYNDGTISGNPGGQQIGWSGPASNGGSGGWLGLEYTLPNLGGQSSVIFRFAFGSDGSVNNYEGFAFDNIFILEAPANDAAAVSVEPSSICPGNLDVLVTVKNRGINNLSSVRVSASVDGNAIVTNQLVNFSPALQRGEEQIINVGTYAFQGATTHSLSATVSQPSGQTDDNPLNNQAGNSVSFKTGVINSFPYIEDFESGAGNWETQGSTSFALGTPSGNVINSNAPGGTMSWITNPNGNYNNGEGGAVVSPCFNFTNLNVPAIQFNAWWDCEFSWDGCVLQYSTDGGDSWARLGDFQDTLADNWYNDNTINGNPGGQQIGWTSASGGWLDMEYDVSFLGNTPSVVFRFAFGSDGSVNSYDGFAFDNFTILEIPPEDAAIVQIDPASICPGVSDVWVEVENRGSKRLSTVTVTATVNGAPTSGSGVKARFNPPLSRGQSQLVNVGSATFVSGQNYTINASTSLPNGRPDLLPSNDAATLTKEPGLSGTYSVGAGGDFANIASAISELNSVGVCGPTIFAIAPGTYTNAEFTLGEISGASSTNTVTFQPASGTVELQNDPSSTTDNWVFRFNSSAWVTLKDLNLTNTDPSSYGTLVRLIGKTRGITIEGCTLTANSTLNTTSTNLAAVYNSSSNADITKDFTFKNNTVNNPSYGLYMYGDFNSSATDDNENLVIEGNTFTGVKYMGMYMGYCRSFSINNNIVEKVPYTTSYGIYCFYSTAKTAPQVEASGNKVVMYGTTTMYGMYFSGFYNAQPGLISNNMISLLDNPSSSTTYGMYFTSCRNMNIYHNSVYINSGSPTFGRGIYVTSSLSSGIRIVNNCSYNAGGGLAIEIASSTPIQTMNFNNWYSEGPAIGEYANSPYADIASWSAGTGFDGISVSADPKYTAEDDLHANSIAIDTRGLGGLVPTDIDGDPRCPGPGCPGGAFAPDLGADEFEVPPTDLTPGKVVSPTEDGFGCNQNAATPVVIEIANNGSQALDFTVNPALVSWTAGGQSGAITITTGGIPVGGTMNVTVGTIDLSVAGQYVYDVTATVVGDMKTSNDLLEDAATIISRDPINTFPYLEDFNSFPTCVASSTTPCSLPFSSGWTNETNDGHDWIVYSGDAPSTSTGPSADFDGNGNYLYLEYANNSSAVLTSPCIQLPTTQGACPFVTFAYHMYVSGTTSFEVQVSDGGPWQTEFFASGQQSDFNSPDSPWKIAVIDVSSYSGIIRVRFIGNSTTTSFCDVAVDNFAMVDGKFAADFEVNSSTTDACSVFELVNKTAIPTTAAQWSMPGTPGVDYEFVNGTTDRSRIANVRFFGAGQKTIHLLATTVCGRSSQTQTINVTPGIAKLDFDVSQTSGTAWCTIFEFRDESPLATTDWTWGVRKADGSTARIGVDYDFMLGDRRAHEVDLMFYKTGFFDVEFYANAGCDSSKTVVVKRIEILPEDPAPTTTDDNLSGPGIATLTATGQLAGSDIEWYDAERNGNLLFVGNTYNPAVNSTTTFWAREALDIQGSLLGTMAAGNGQSGNMWDVKNETGSVMKITDITVHLSGTGAANIEVFYKAGPFAGFEQNASAWTQIANVGVTSNGSGNETPVPLAVQPDLLPGGVYAFYAISTSGSSFSYTNGTSEGNVFATDGNLTMYEGIGVATPLFSTTRFSPRVWNGRMNYKIGGCPSEPAPATAYVGNVPPLSILPANGNDRRSADWSVVEGPWTHYYDNNGTPANIADDYRLLSLRLGGQNIGSIGDGTFQVEMSSTPNAGTGYAVDLTSTAGYLGPNQGALAMNRYWNVTATNQPTQPVGVRFYYNDEDVVDLNATLIQDLEENAVDHTQLAFNKIATNENPDPTNNGHATVDPGEYINIVHGTTPGTSTWVKGQIRDFHYAEFEVNSFSGGTGGVASNLTSGSLPVELVDFEVSQVANTALLEWTSATEINTEVYEIERSVDGAVFEVIGEQEAAGNSQVALSYSFTDDKPVEGRNYYRLRMVDADGSFGYSEVRTLTFEAEALTLAAYPNPFSSDFMVTFTTEQKGAVQISIFDAAGKQIHSQQIDEVVPGVNNVKIAPANDLSQGVYIMTLTQNGVSQRLQVVKQ